MNDPRISCLLVTKDAMKFPYLVKAYGCYRAQTYENKELVIICGGSCDYFNEINKLVENTPRVSLYHIDEDATGLTLGDVRNISIEKASGDIIVNWDDDDLNHPQRLEIQLKQMQDEGSDVSYFTDQMHYLYDTKEMFWVNWGNDCIPGTFMAWKDKIQNFKHPSQPLAEDAVLRDEILSSDLKVSKISRQGYLYVYTFNAHGVYNRDHHTSKIIHGKDLKFMADPHMKLKSLKYINEYVSEDIHYVYPYNKFYASLKNW